jgi:hypothetical protein
MGQQGLLQPCQSRSRAGALRLGRADRSHVESLAIAIVTITNEAIDHRDLGWPAINPGRGRSPERSRPHRRHET